MKGGGGLDGTEGEECGEVCVLVIGRSPFAESPMLNKSLAPNRTVSLRRTYRPPAAFRTGSGDGAWTSEKARLCVRDCECVVEGGEEVI